MQKQNAARRRIAGRFIELRCEGLSEQEATERAREEIDTAAPPSDDKEIDTASRHQRLVDAATWLGISPTRAMATAVEATAGAGAGAKAPADLRTSRPPRFDCGAGADSTGGPSDSDGDDEPPGRARWQLPASDDAPGGAVLDDRRLRVLLARQARAGPRILAELRAHGEKRDCWIWWIYPTAKEGMCEPRPRTAVAAGTTAPLLLERAPSVWRAVLEQIGVLVVAKGMRLDDVLPTIDHGRVRAFIPFWRGVLEEHPCDWMSQHLDILDEAFYKKRGKSSLFKPSINTCGSF